MSEEEDLDEDSDEEEESPPIALAFNEKGELDLYNPEKEQEKFLQSLLEPLSALEHDQWIEWSKALEIFISEASKGAIDRKFWRWKQLWVPYSQLSEESKEQDRVWARKIISLLRDKVTN